MNVTTQRRDEIIRTLSKIIFLKEEILFAYLHGSFLEELNFEDIDIAVYVEERMLAQIDITDYEISSSLAVEKELRIPSDVKILNSAPLTFRYHVSCGLLLFSRDESKREEFLCDTWKQYFDFLPIAKLYLREVLSVQI